jgi:hypothetical protein
MENIINEGQVLTFEGKQYTMRRLNTRDVFKVASILGKVYKPGFTYKEGEEASFTSALLSALPVAEDDIVNLLSGLLSLTVEQFEELPPEAIFDIVEALAKSEDLKRFFDKVKTLMTKLSPKTTAPAQA